MKALLAFAQIANDVYEPAYRKVDFQGWSRVAANDAEYHSGSFMARAYQNTKMGAYAVAFRGTYLADLQDTLSDADADVRGIGLGSLSILKVLQAMHFSSRWARNHKQFWLIGHSLGGAYVQLVAAKLNMLGVTFNSPGVLHLINQMSGHRIEKIVGSATEPAVQVLAGLALSLTSPATLLTQGPRPFISGVGQATGFLDKAASSEDNAAFPAILNYRASADVVSQCGVQIGSPEQSVQVAGDKGILNQHSMERLVEYFGGPKVLTPITPPPPGPQVDSLNSLRRDA